MGQNVFKPTGKLKKNQPGAGKAQTQDVPLIATVMNNIDPTNSGRIDVYPSESLDKAAYDKSAWISVRKLSTFFGAVTPVAGDDELGSYVSNPSSYGQWNAPPDIGTKVVCIFINGDMNYGFYIGAVADGSELQMVPAIGSSDLIIPNEGEAQSYGGATTLPVTNINTNNPDVSDNPDYLKSPKPIHSYTASIMHQQGILRDRIRGPISSSASREATSRVGWGVSTPGRPIYTGGYTDETLPSNLGAEADTLKVIARRGGHSIVMDDGDIIGRDQLIRLRTSLGHQILMSDDGQTMMLLHANGQSYIELGKEGTVDVFATNSINLRTQGDLNLHADNMVNIHAGKDINLNATENMIVNSDKKFMQRVGENYELYSLKDLLFKSDTNIALDAAGKASVKSGGEAFVEGAKIHLNDGSAGVNPVKVEPIPIVKHTDTLFDEQTGWSAAPGKLDSITSRAPAHYPWLGAGQGVDVQVNSSASEALPPQPSSNVSELNASAATTASSPGVSEATIASVPEVSAISKSFDKNATTAMLGGVASQAATGVAKLATTQGVTTFVNSATNQATAAIGSFAQTPSQLASGGILKPGADNMVNSLVSAGKATVQQAMPQSIFTGKDGVNSLNKLTSSVSAQAKSVVNNMQQAQTGLALAGAITGKEAPGAIGGLVNAASGAAASVGKIGDQVSAVTSLVKNGASASGIASTVKSAALKNIKQGTESAIASTLTGGLGGITKSLTSISKVADFGNSLDTNIGPVASAFKTITKTFKPFEANKPQDLTAIAKGVASEIIAGSNVNASSLLDTATELAEGTASDLVSNAIESSNNSIGALSSSASSLLQQANGLSGAAAQVQKGLSAGSAVAAATGLSDLPGGTSIAGALVNNAKGAVNAVTGNITSVTNAVASLGAKAFSGQTALPNLPGQNALGGIASALTSNLPAGVQAAVNSALSALTSGGGSTVKLPTIGINTFDRSAITSAINNVLGPDIIPRPNLLGEISPAVLSVADSLLSQQKSLAVAAKKLSTANKAAVAAQSKYAEALSSLPAGSPEIETLKAAYDTAVAAVNTAKKELETVEQNTSRQAQASVANQLNEAKDDTVESFELLEDLIGTAAENDQTLALIASSQTAGSNIDRSTFDDNTGFDPASINSVTGETFRFTTFSNALATTTSFETQPIVTDEVAIEEETAPPQDIVQDNGADVPENTVDAVVGPPPVTVPNTNPNPGGGGCVVLESYIPAVESAIINGRLIEQAWQLRPDHNISLGKGDASLETYVGKVVFNYVELQPCVRLLTKSGVSLVCSTTAPIFTKDLEFVDAPDLMCKEVACMKNDETFWDEIVSIEDVGEKFVAVINAGDTAFWAGETNEAFILHHNVADRKGIYFDKK